MGNIDKVGGEHTWGISANPQDSLILGAIAVGILDSRLCFANPAQATEPLGLGQRRGSISLQGVVEAREHLLPSSEERISPIRDIPDGGDHVSTYVHTIFTKQTNRQKLALERTIRLYILLL